MPEQTPMDPKRRQKAMWMADNCMFIAPHLDFIVKLWLRITSKKSLCRLVQLLLPEYIVLDIVMGEGEILPHAWKRMLSDGSVVTEIPKTFHLDNLATIKVLHGSDLDPYFMYLNIESQSRDRMDLVFRQDLYTATIAGMSCKRGEEYIDLAGKLRAVSIVFCFQSIKYFADPKVCDDSGRVIHHLGGSHYRENLHVSTNLSSSIFVDLNKLLQKPENDRIVLGSPVLGAFLAVLGGLDKMNGEQVLRIMEKGGEPVTEFVNTMIDISERRILRDKRDKLLSEKSLHEADVRDARSEGKNKAQKEIAQKLIFRGFKHDEIAQLTGLSVSEVKEMS